MRELCPYYEAMSKLSKIAQLALVRSVLNIGVVFIWFLDLILVATPLFTPSPIPFDRGILFMTYGCRVTN